MNVLIIEPSKLFQKLLSEIVLSGGGIPVVVSNGEDAMDKMAGTEFQLICVANTLESGDGKEFLATLKKQGVLHSKTKTVLCTSNSSNEVVMEGLKAGFTDVLNKLDFKKLEQGLRSLVRQFDYSVVGRVLLIDDCADVADLMASILRSLGMLVDVFEEPGPALRAFEQNDYDIVITDVVLPGNMTGMGVVTAVRGSHGMKGSVPILAISGDGDVLRRVELLKNGANDFVAKPLDHEEFAVRVINLIRGKKLQDSLHAKQQELYELATLDSLTGLFNRYSVSEFAPKYFSDARRHKRPLSLLVLDIDFFKRINDERGHDTGDKVLRAVGRFLKESTRESDLSARYGGEEFISLLSHCDQENAVVKAEQIRAGVEMLNPDGVPVTVSIGVATMPLDEKVGFEDLFSLADLALYQAKEGGRNQVCVKKNSQ